MRTRARKSEVVYLNRKWILLALLLLMVFAWAFCDSSSAGSVQTARQMPLQARSNTEPIRALHYKPFTNSSEKNNNWTTVRMRVTVLMSSSVRTKKP